MPESAVTADRVAAEKGEIDFGCFDFNGLKVRITLLPDGRARAERETKPGWKDFTSVAQYLWHRVKSWFGIAGGDAWRLGQRECANIISARWALVRCPPTVAENAAEVDAPLAQPASAQIAQPEARQVPRQASGKDCRRDPQQISAQASRQVSRRATRQVSQVGLLTLPTEMLKAILALLPLRSRLQLARLVCRNLSQRLASDARIDEATLHAGATDSIRGLRRTCTALQAAEVGQDGPLPPSSQLQLLQMLVGRLPFVPPRQFMAAWAALFCATATVRTVRDAQERVRADVSEALAQALSQALSQAGEEKWHVDTASAMTPIQAPASMASAVLALLNVLLRLGHHQRIEAWLPDLPSCLALAQALPESRQKEGLATVAMLWLIRGHDRHDAMSHAPLWVEAVEHLAQRSDLYPPPFRSRAMAQLADLLPGSRGMMLRLVNMKNVGPGEAARHWAMVLDAARALPRETVQAVAIGLAHAIFHFRGDGERVSAAITALGELLQHRGAEPPWSASVQACLLPYLPEEDRAPQWQRLWELAKADRTGAAAVDVAGALCYVPGYAGWRRILDDCCDEATVATPEQRAALIRVVRDATSGVRARPEGLVHAIMRTACHLAERYGAFEPLLGLVPGVGEDARQVFALIAPYPLERRAGVLVHWLRQQRDWEAGTLDAATRVAVELAQSPVAEHWRHGGDLVEALADKCKLMVRAVGRDREVPSYIGQLATGLLAMVERHPPLQRANVLGALANLVNAMDWSCAPPFQHMTIEFALQVGLALDRLWGLVDRQHANVRRATLHEAFRRKPYYRPGSLYSPGEDWSVASIRRATKVTASLRWDIAGILSYLVDTEQASTARWALQFRPARQELAETVLGSSDADFQAIAPEVLARWRQPVDKEEFQRWRTAMDAIQKRMCLLSGELA